MEENKKVLSCVGHAEKEQERTMYVVPIEASST
jgi:hypothetical protein